MSPYLERRGEEFNDARWLELVPRAEFFLIVDGSTTQANPVGFFSIRRDPDCPSVMHVGDVQIDSQQQNRGAGSAALRWIEDTALSRGFTELTLNVFRDNPALRLYERFGFYCVDTQFYKYKMRKSLSR